jgi:tyrosyl-tRNA synthetase
MRRKMAEGGVKINGNTVTDPKVWVRYDTIDPDVGAFLVQFGKKKHALVKPV